MPPVLVSVSGIPLFVSVLFLVFFIPAVSVMRFMICVISIAPSISIRRRPAAFVAPVPCGLAVQVSSCGRVYGGSGLAGAPLEPGGAQGVEQKALVGAPEGTLQPEREVNKV